MKPPTLAWNDICNHTPHCQPADRMKVKVPNYLTYHKASHWLRTVRKQKFIIAHGVTHEGRHTGEYEFHFLCEREFVAFVLTWC